MQLILNKDTNNKIEVLSVNYAYLRDGEINKTISVSLNPDKANSAITYLLSLVENGTQVTDFHLIGNSDNVLYDHIPVSLSVSQINDRAENINRNIEVEFSEVK